MQPMVTPAAPKTLVKLAARIAPGLFPFGGAPQPPCVTVTSGPTATPVISSTPESYPEVALEPSPMNLVGAVVAQLPSKMLGKDGGKQQERCNGVEWKPMPGKAFRSLTDIHG